jgi:hypothetical protein
VGVRIIYGEGTASMYCSTTDIAFGPVFYDSDDHIAEERVAAFIDWLSKDARQYSDEELLVKYAEFIVAEPGYWKKQEKEEDEEV